MQYYNRLIPEARTLLNTSMPLKKVEVTLKFPKCLHLKKLLLAYIVLLMPYNFCNHNIFISLKITMIFKLELLPHSVYNSCI